MVRISNSRSTGRSGASGANQRHNGSRVARRYDSRRLEILSAAARAFRERGFAQTGMREIAAVADLSPANLYHYFEGKQELLYFCQEASLERLLAALDAAKRARQPAAARLQAVIEAHVRCVLGEMEGASAHLEVDDLPPALRRRIVGRRDRYERGIRSIIAAGIKSREFTPADPKLVTRAILGSLNWTVRWYRPDGPQTPSQVGAAFAAYLVRGLIRTPARASRNGRRAA